MPSRKEAASHSSDNMPEETDSPSRSGEHTKSAPYVCLVDRWSYDRRDDAEAHVRIRHGATNYGSYLAKRGTSLRADMALDSIKRSSNKRTWKLRRLPEHD